MNITFIRGTILLIFFLLRCTVVGLEVVRDAFGLGRKLSASVIWEDLSHQGVLMLLDIKSWCLLCNAHTLIIPAVCHFECFVICIFSSITRNFQIFIRVRNAGASGRECSALAGRHYLPPRQAGFTSFLTKKSNCNPLEDVASPHWAKTSLSSTLRIISSKEDGSPCLVIADEDLTLDFEAGTPGTSNHGAGVRCFISAHEKIFRIDLWDKTRSSGVARMRERRGGPALPRKRHCAPSGGEKTNNNHSQKNACEIL